MESSIKTLNECEVTLTKNWVITATYKFCNVTCDAGRESLAARLVDFAPEISKLGIIQYIAIGTDNTAATIWDTQLGAEIHRSPLDLINSVAVGTVATIYTTFPTWPSYTAEEAGVFTDIEATTTPNSWSLLCHSVFWVAIVKPSDQALTVKWTISITNA